MTATYAEPDFATSGPSGSILDGGMMLWAGLSFGTASFVQYLTQTDIIHLPSPALTGVIWMAAMAVFVLGGVVFKLGSSRAHLDHPAVRRFRSIWLSLILGGMVVTAALIVVLIRAKAGAVSAFVSAPVMTCVYGAGWRIAGVMSGRKIFGYLSLGSFAAAIGLACLAGTAGQSLAYAATLLCFAVVPGALLMRSQA